MLEKQQCSPVLALKGRFGPLVFPRVSLRAGVQYGDRQQAWLGKFLHLKNCEEGLWLPCS